VPSDFESVGLAAWVGFLERGDCGLEGAEADVALSGRQQGRLTDVCWAQKGVGGRARTQGQIVSE